MLLKRRTLDAIVAGEVDLVFRRWKRPTVRAGGTLRTVVGELAIDAVDRIALSDLDADAARAAGFDSLAALRAELKGREGALYRIRVRFAGADARIALRDDAELDADELDGIAARLERMDARSASGPWTREALELIDARPATRAGDLAASIGSEQKPFKQRVRRLKELGLTESLEVGYRLSPRGAVVLAHLRRRRR